MSITRASVGVRVYKMQAVFFLRIWSQKGGRGPRHSLAETVKTGHENLVDVLDSSA